MNTEISARSQYALKHRNRALVQPTLAKEVSHSLVHLGAVKSTKRRAVESKLRRIAERTDGVSDGDVKHVAHAEIPALLEAAGIAPTGGGVTMRGDILAKATIADAAAVVLPRLMEAGLVKKSHKLRKMSGSEIAKLWEQAEGGIPADSWLIGVKSFAEQRTGTAQLKPQEHGGLTVALGAAHQAWKSKQIDRAIGGNTGKIDPMKGNPSYGAFGLLPERTFGNKMKAAVDRGLNRTDAEKEAYAATVVELFKDLKEVGEAHEAAGSNI